MTIRCRWCESRASNTLWADGSSPTTWSPASNIYHYVPLTLTYTGRNGHEWEWRDEWVVSCIKFLFRKTRARCMGVTVNHWLAEFDSQVRSQNLSRCSEMVSPVLWEHVAQVRFLPPRPTIMGWWYNWEHSGFASLSSGFDSPSVHQNSPWLMAYNETNSQSS